MINTSPLNPYVAIDDKSSKDWSLLVVKRSQTISISSFCKKYKYNKLQIRNVSLTNVYWCTLPWCQSRCPEWGWASVRPLSLLSGYLWPLHPNWGFETNISFSLCVTCSCWHIRVISHHMCVCVPYVQVQICFNNKQLVPMFMFNIDIFKHTTALCHFSMIQILFSTIIYILF